MLIDEREGEQRGKFYAEGGIRDFVGYINASKDPIHKRIVYFEGEMEQGQVEVAMQWNASYVESVFSFANNINTHEGAPLGLQGALTGTPEPLREGEGLLKEKEDNLEGEDVREDCRGHLRQAPRSAVRGARRRPSWAIRGSAASSSRPSTRSSRSSSRRTRPTRSRSS